MRLSAPVKAAAQRLTLPFLIFVSALLAILGKADVMLFDRVRVVVADAVSPLIGAIGQPDGTISDGIAKLEDMSTVYSQNRELRDENDRLLQWQETARR